MIKLDDVPNTVDERNLGGVPNANDAQFRSGGRANETSAEFVTWPAHSLEQPVPVRISTSELSALVELGFGIDNEKIISALTSCRAYIERRANEEFKDGVTEVVLDAGSLYPIRGVA